jgi:hypothetical protein
MRECSNIQSGLGRTQAKGDELEELATSTSAPGKSSRDWKEPRWEVRRASGGQ